MEETTESKNDYKPSDLIFYMFDEKGNLKVLTTISRPLTEEEFAVVEQNLAAYAYVLSNQGLR